MVAPNVFVENTAPMSVSNLEWHARSKTLKPAVIPVRDSTGRHSNAVLFVGWSA